MSVRYVINSDNAAWRIVEGEAVILSAETTYYYSLNRSGTFLWKLLLEQALGVEELTAVLSSHYERPAGDATPQVEAVVDLLRADKLIIEAPNGAGGDADLSPTELIAEVVAAGDTPSVNGGYEAPSVTKFDSLEKLIVSGE